MTSTARSVGSPCERCIQVFQRFISKVQDSTAQTSKLPQFEGWELINEILMDLHDELQITREENRAGEVDWRVNKGRKQGIKIAMLIVRQAVSDKYDI
jgi:hypothetical protein